MNLDPLFAKYDVPVPRYTSYPTVPHWSDRLDTNSWLASMRASLEPEDATLGLYIHLPFCESLCTFCGCNTVITRDHGRERSYLDLIAGELDLYLGHVPRLSATRVVQLHLGGGTPTFFSSEHLRALVDAIAGRLALPRDTDLFEGSVEVDPRVTSAAQLEALHDRGFTRISFGVQDIEPEVQNLVNRVQPASLTTTLCAAARACGYDSINIDLIYGLPGQTPESMRRLAAWVVDLAPDRLAVYSFARVPWIKPAQRKFRDDQVPEGPAKRALYDIIRAALADAGYQEIGLDHFARPEDGLARAVREGRLSRNFMGYTDRVVTTLLGLGVSAISETPGCYHQNEKVLPTYERRVRSGDLATLRGHVLTDEDRRQRRKIMRLLTSYRTEMDPGDLAEGAGELAELASDGLVDLLGRDVVVRPAGIPFLRNIARCFDARHRAAPPTSPVHARAI